MNKRLFVAIDPPVAVREQLNSFALGLPGARWTEPEQLHLTLCFIGEVDGSRFLDIKEGLAELQHPVFNLRLKGLGCFPPRQAPRILWVGVQASEQLSILQRKISTKIRHIGVLVEKRKFTPHVTLARLDESNGLRLGAYLAAHALFASDPFVVERYTLYSSILGRKGASHMVEETYDLGNV